LKWFGKEKKNVRVPAPLFTIKVSEFIEESGAARLSFRLYINGEFSSGITSFPASEIIPKLRGGDEIIIEELRPILGE
jgi:hypothetical protein